MAYRCGILQYCGWARYTDSDGIVSKREYLDSDARCPLRKNLPECIQSITLGA